MSTSVSRAHRNWQTGETFTVSDATELYEVDRLGKGLLFDLAVGPCPRPSDQGSGQAIDLKQLTDHLMLRGIQLPVLIRFRDILRHRLGDIHNAFKSAIAQHQYEGRYVCVYPIKVNQQRQVVEEVLDFGREYGFGLEAGSKPELLAVAAQAYNDTPIICNGFKDAEFIEMAMLAQKIGRTVIPVVEKYTELGLILKYAREGRRPAADRHARQAGGPGRRALAGLRRLPLEVRPDGHRSAARPRGAAGARHAGLLQAAALPSRQPDSQHPDRQGGAERGGAHLHRARQGGRRPEYLDVGGGLGVDYDGSQTNFESSVNYTLEEYANDVVYHIQTVCDDAGVKHPTIVSESGRAIVAYHSVLIFNVLGVSAFGEEKIPESI